MEAFLKQILNQKKEELEESKRRGSLTSLKERLPFQEPRRSLVQALISAHSSKLKAHSKITPYQLPAMSYQLPSTSYQLSATSLSGTTHIIAEIKRASPSKGMLRADLNPVALAQSYQQGGAAAISVLTERHFFLGELEYLEQIREVCLLPLLRKDFLFDPYHLYEARAYGADAVLLIAAILEGSQLEELVETCMELGIEPLVEVHTREEMEKVLRTKALLIGINNRNLQTFQTDLRTTLELIREIPEGKIVVSESGIRNRADIVLLEEAGVDAFLIGESLVRAANPEAKIKELLGNG